jgi:hypothetical protein
MILLLVIGEKSAYKKESRERERVREREAHRKATVALWFHPLLKKNSPLLPAKTLCAAWRGTHSQIKISQSPPRTRVPFIVLFEHVTS